MAVGSFFYFVRCFVRESSSVATVHSGGWHCCPCGCSNTACIATSALDPYLLYSDGTLLNLIPYEKDTRESFNVLIPYALRRVLSSHYM